MNLDKTQIKSILDYELEGFASTAFEDIMTQQLQTPLLTMQKRDIIHRASAYPQLSIDELVKLRQAELQLLETKQAELDADTRSKRELAGRELASKAVQYLFGAADDHEVEFPIGHSDPSIRKCAQDKLNGYMAHLAFLDEKQVLTFDETGNTFTAHGTGRILVRLETDLDENNAPAVISYVDGDQYRHRQIESNDPKRIIAQA